MNFSIELPALASIEKFIKQNQHLPGIPSAQEVKENGIDLEESQSALLKKTEEITLYLIEMDKRLNRLTSENEL